ncbi:MAG: hypothetical protein EXR59_06040 [Dehalococcoidia bacterium]|nr:hypothetical protein [Dehalococcoidia bacterium]
MSPKRIRPLKSLSSIAALTGAAALIIAAIWVFQSNSKSETPTIYRQGFETAHVARVIDGDTIELTDKSVIRYLSMDTPETVKPGSPVECMGPEASARNKQLVDGKTIEILADKEDTDKYGRKLRYVFADKTFVNAQLIWEGLARASIFDPQERFAQTIVQFERAAREAQRGGWKACGWQ